MRGKDKKKTAGNNRAITVAEIARLCGVSRVTVSAVLNDRRKVRESTRAKILKCIQEHNYQSGIIAKSLIGEISRIVAVLIPDIDNLFHVALFKGINDVLMESGYCVLLFAIGIKGEGPFSLSQLQQYRPGGFIIVRGAEGDAKHVQAILESGVPLVTGGGPWAADSNAVAMDETEAMSMATDYVIDRGHRHICYLAGNSAQRTMGFITSVTRHDIDLAETPIVTAGETIESGYAAALKVLKNPARPTALVCFNDMVALGAYRAAEELSLRIPEDVSVMGFDGTELIQRWCPSLTTVNVRPYEVGRQSAKLLLKIIRSEIKNTPVRELIKAEILQNTSVRSL